MSGVLGFAATGFVIDTFGSRDLYLMAAGLSLASIGLIIMMARIHRKVITIQNASQPEYVNHLVKVNADSYYRYDNHIMNNSASRKL